MTTKKVVATITAIITIAVASVSTAQTENILKDNWVILGSRTVDYAIDRDVIPINNREIFTALKFTVKNGTLNMHKCTVHFTDGDSRIIEFSDDGNKPNEERIMDLKGSYRTIEKVTFWYDTKNSSEKKSVVEVWGRK